MINNNIKTLYQTRQKYLNFTADVEILCENRAGTHYSLYAVRNKNNIEIQNVQGAPGVRDAGTMGHIRGDRARPILISSATKTNNTASSTTSPIPPADINTNQWDIRLTVSDPCGGSNTETKVGYISAS